MGAAMVGLLSLVLMVRHTRGEEEAGLTELVGAGVVGRWAQVAAAAIVVGATDLVLALLTAVSLAASGLGLVGALSFGLAWFVTGVTFAAVAAVTAQLTSTSRGASGTASGILGLAYLVRAVADGSTDGNLSGLRWMSPVGWAQEVHAFGDIRWAVSALGVGAALVLVAVALALVDRRDLGAGMMPTAPGARTRRGRCPPRSRSPRACTGRP